MGDEKLTDVLARLGCVSPVRRRVRGVVAGRFVLVGVKPGGKGHQGRPTQGGGHVASPEQRAFRCQFIEAGGLDARMPHESVVGVSLIIGEDQDDVRGLRIRCAKGRTRAHKEAKQRQ